jgi:hypothetical protein
LDTIYIQAKRWERTAAERVLDRGRAASPAVAVVVAPRSRSEDLGNRDLEAGKEG